MSDDIQDPASATEQLAAPPVEDAAVSSVLSEVRGLRETLGANSKPLTLAVPGYNGLLLVRYKWVPFEQLSRSAQGLAKIEKLSERQVVAACDTLVETCDEILIRVEDEVKPLATPGEQPYTFSTPQLGNKLGFPVADNAKDNVRFTFQNEYALISTANRIVEWLQDTTKDVTEVTLGN